jgi:hypothetical protein
VGAIATLFAFVPVFLGPVRSIVTMPLPAGQTAVSDPTGEAVDETSWPVVGSPRASLDQE